MKHPLARAATVCLLLAATSVFLANARKNELPVERASFTSFPMQIGAWRAVVDPPIDADILKVLGVDDYLSRVYYQQGRAVGLYMGFYGSQRQGANHWTHIVVVSGWGWGTRGGSNRCSSRCSASIIKNARMNTTHPENS